MAKRRSRPITIRRYDVVQIQNDDGVWRDYYTLREPHEYGYAKQRRGIFSKDHNIRFHANRHDWRGPIPIDALTVWEDWS